ncbi:unnamed protein product [Schistosoma rodhaini]|nr:unnamed protein product [Schistosoma rodhaini]
MWIEGVGSALTSGHVIIIVVVVVISVGVSISIISIIMFSLTIVSVLRRCCCCCGQGLREVVCPLAICVTCRIGEMSVCQLV